MSKKPMTLYHYYIAPVFVVVKASGPEDAIRIMNEKMKEAEPEDWSFAQQHDKSGFVMPMLLTNEEVSSMRVSKMSLTKGLDELFMAAYKRSLK